MEYRDAARCEVCGGKCCRVYIKRCEGGQMPDYIHWANDNILDDTQNFEYYFKHSVWYLEKDNFNIEPRYDVFEANRAWLDSYIYDDSSLRKAEALEYLKELKNRGIIIGYCAYWSKESGCIIAWEKRPANCKEHRCRKWINEEEQIEEYIF